MDKEKKRIAMYFFKQGFLHSREGYNGECAFDHLYPHNPDKFNGTWDDFDSDVRTQLEQRFQILWTRNNNKFNY